MPATTHAKRIGGPSWYPEIWVCRNCSAVHCYQANGCQSCKGALSKRKNPNHKPAKS